MHPTLQRLFDSTTPTGTADLDMPITPNEFMQMLTDTMNRQHRDTWDTPERIGDVSLDAIRALAELNRELQRIGVNDAAYG